MANVGEIIDYIKSLKRGFDKDLFECKLAELAHAVETTGLDYDDFHTLFKVWLNLQIPITKWTNLGACLVPPGMVEEQTVEYSFRWILANCDKPQMSYPRIGFVLDWLTAAMQCDCIDMKALDSGYELFYILLTYECLTVHAVKLVYTLTKPADVTRRRVLELLDYTKRREGKKNLYRQLQVVLGLFKSYKPECVPEDVPAISIHTSFKKINVALLERFRRIQDRKNYLKKESQHLMWTNPMNSVRGRNNKVEPLVPNMEFLNGSKQYSHSQPQKNYLDFSEPQSLLQYSVAHSMSRPARLRALLCNETGLMLLAVASDKDHAFLSHDLHHLLTTCFLDGSAHSYAEKADFLRRLAVLQRSLLQGLPVVTQFLVQLLPFWDEKEYFAEILELVQWVSVDSPELVLGVAQPLARAYLRAQPLQQCAILNSLTNMYTNLVFGSTRTRQHFMSMKPKEDNYSYVLPLVAKSINDMCNKALQVNPEDMRILHAVSQASIRMCCVEPLGQPSLPVPGPLALALPLLGASAALLEHAAWLMLRYKKIFKLLRQSDNFKKEQYTEHLQTLKAYTWDLTSCLCSEEALRGREKGLVFKRLHPQLVGKMYSLMPDVDSRLSLRNHIALAPYTYMRLKAMYHRDADNKALFDTVIDQQFTHLGDFLRKAVPEWGHV